MVAPRLLLLTKHFPFGVREPFLETEISYLAQELRVAILPTSVAPDEWSAARPLPPGVAVYEDAARRLSFEATRWRQKLRPSAVWFRFSLLAGRELLRTPLRGWTVRRLVYFTLHALLIHGELLRLPPADVYYSYWLLAEALALTLQKKANHSCLFLSRAHRNDLYRDLSMGLYQPYRKTIVEDLDHVVCISEHGQRLLQTQYPSNATRIRLSRLGVNPADVRNRLAATGTLHIVSCAFLRPVKRMDILIDALSLCSVPVRWTHLGGGELEPSLRARAETLPENVTWTISGTVSNRTVHTFYKSEPVDLFVNVSASEGLPVSIMEALSYGIPVAATMVGGTAELVNESNGFPLPRNVTPALLAQTFAHFFGLPLSRIQAMREAAWQTWKEETNAREQYGSFASWLREASESKAR